MLEFLLTLCLFNLTVVLIPLFGVSYIVLWITHSIWLGCISILYPEVEFIKTVTIRTLLDTHRNQGIISVLLSVKGPSEPEAVRRHLQEVVRRRNKTGSLAFPRLRHCLTTKCGTYAWQRGKFDLDQNVTVAPFTYKGRPVTEYNIQEYVSEIVSKYLPAGVPPWQVVIIPTSDAHHYILLKLHHILLSEGLNIGDLLPLIPPTRQSTSTFSSKSPLVDVFKKPVAIPTLKQQLTEEFSNLWNEFVANYDPLERPELLKSTPTLLKFYGITLVALISLIKECRKGFRVIKDDWFSKIKYVLITVKREALKRNVTPHNYILSISATLNPRNIFNNFLWCMWFFFVSCPIRIPIILYAEFLAFYACVTLRYCPYPHTFVGMLYTYIPLVYSSIKEVIYCLTILFSAPKTIIQDILLKKETLQTVTLCGRKCVAWSDPVKLESIKEIAKSTGVSEIEVSLNAISVCISKYFTQTHQVMPDEMPITIRNINSNYVFATGNNVKPEDSISGILCLNLPVLDPEKEETILENLIEIKKSFGETIEKQGLSHLLTLLQTKFGVLTKFLPSTFVSIYLKYLSRKYAITVTEVTSRHPNVTQRTLWGQEVIGVIYWRPPQANTSISLCLNEYSDHIKLGVMCDAQLVPHHSVLARGFPEYIQELSRATGV